MGLPIEEKLFKEDLMSVWCFVPPTRDGLVGLKRRALRFGVWVKALSEDMRKYFNLVVSVVDKIRSVVLKQILAPIVKRLLEAMKNLGGDLNLMMRTVGLKLAEKNVQLAISWGNFLAIKWLNDFRFIRYLTVMHVYGDMF